MIMWQPHRMLPVSWSDDSNISTLQQYLYSKYNCESACMNWGGYDSVCQKCNSLPHANTVWIGTSMRAPKSMDTPCAQSVPIAKDTSLKQTPKKHAPMCVLRYSRKQAPAHSCTLRVQAALELSVLTSTRHRCCCSMQDSAT